MTGMVPVILSGSSGTRLWPLSRSLYPKQFIRFNGRQASFLGATLGRLKPEAGFSAPILLCGNDHRFLVRDEFDRAGIEPKAVILEPVARDTAAAIVVAALSATADDPAAVLAVMPSDHVISDEQGFAGRVLRAGEVARSGKFVLFGVKPTKWHTGYGHIQRGAPLDGFDDAFVVDAFHEKPNEADARIYAAADRFFWNSGIFILHARAFLDEVERFEPLLLEAATAALAGAERDLGFLRLDRAPFARAPRISVDRAIMEKTKAAAMIPIDVGWNDIGSWSSLWEEAPRDEQANHVEGDALLEDTSGCYVHSEKALVATIGVKDLVIIGTPDALLVADKSRAQEVSKIVARLKQSKRKEEERHLRNFRPWGYFETLDIGPRFQVKLLHVNPGGKLSMQMHHHRSEHWVVVHGTAKVVIGTSEQLVRENESVYITATQWHRLENPGETGLEIIEVQIGGYLGEDDIVRADDIYHRTPDETK